MSTSPSRDAGAAQVVLLGAGYDTRAYRFAEQLAGRPVFQVDLASISRAKAATIARHHEQFPDANVQRVEIDFETQVLTDILPDAGFTAVGATFFTWEGVPMYLTRAALTPTLDAVRDLGGDGAQIAHDIRVLVDDPGPRGTTSRSAPGALSLIGEPITFGVHPEDHEYSWVGTASTSSTCPPSELQARYAPNTHEPGDDSVYVLTAERVGA
jgi:methyltransferase (TIGR00027 family)